MEKFGIDIDKTRKNNQDYIFLTPCVTWRSICVNFNKGKCKKGYKITAEPWGDDTDYLSEDCPSPEYKTVLTWDDEKKDFKIINRQFVKNRLNGLGKTMFHHDDMEE